MATEETGVVEATAEDVTGPEPDLAPAVDDLLPAVIDPTDQHEVMLRMDDHDVRMLLEQVQSSALRKWVYELKQGNDPTKWPRGLTVHAVEDIVQRMNWTGKCQIGLLLDVNGRPVIDIETIMADEGNGPEPFWVATAYAHDDVTNMVLPGASMEPQRMKLKDYTAKKKREAGQKIPEDNTIFDRFARQKAIQKATRNALNSFIPEEIKQTVIAMFANDPGRVERIQTREEQRVAELPPALTDERAVQQVARAREMYAVIRELGGGRGKLELTPALFNAYLTAAQHDHDRLEDFSGWLEQRHAEIENKYAEGSA